jgi:preflagellin peptidase FlaK
VVSPLIVPALAIGITLCYASFLDIKERKVPFQTWYPMLIVGLPAVALFYFLLIFGGATDTALYYGALVLFFCAMFYFFAYFHLFGGADAWALIFISLCIPAFPFPPFLGIPPLAFFPFSVLINAMLLNLFIPLGILLMNLKKGNNAPFPYMLFGFPVEGDRIGDHYGYVMEDITEDNGQIRRRFIGIRESLANMVTEKGRVYTLDIRRKPDEYAKERDLYKKAGRVWISYGVPFIVPITAGLFSALFFGDFIFGLLQVFIGG